MKMQITTTTDGRYIGHVFDSKDNPIQLSPDVSVPVDKVIELLLGTRFVNSSYIIDAVEV